jgi:hypothetical protein
MEFEAYKSAWQRQPVERRTFSSGARLSRSVQFVRTGAIRDLQRSEELSRLIFSLLFALVAIGASLKVMPPGAARIAAWLFGAALLADAVAGVVIVTRRLREPATATMLEFISREHRLAGARLRFERYSRWLMLMLAAVAIVLLFLVPGPTGLRENALEALSRMAIVTAFLAVAWRRVRSRSRQIHTELDRYLKDLEA